MSDSAHIAVRHREGCVWLYGHWCGEAAPTVLQQALAREERSDDGPYLARIVFSEMIWGGERSELGKYPIPTVASACSASLSISPFRKFHGSHFDEDRKD